MSKKNILEVCLSPDLGGLELFVINCFNFFKNDTKSLIVVTPNSKMDSYIGDEKEKITLKRNKFFPLLPALKLASIIDKNDMDIVHFHWTKDMPTVVLAKLLSRKKPKLVQTRNMHITRFKSDFYHKWLYKNISTIHAVTNQVKEELTKYIPKEVRPKIEVVYMGVKEPQKDLETDDLKEKYNLQDDFIVGIIGRIEDAKGQKILIEALEKLKDLKIKVLIIGHTMDEEYLKNLKRYTKDLGLEEKVIFTGFTKEVERHLKLCDVTVLATQNETFGLVVVESMINKVPVIATNNGGPLEIIDDQKDGILFDRTAGDLAKKIKYLYENREYLEKLSQNAYKKAVEKFLYEKQLEKLKKVLYES